MELFDMSLFGLDRHGRSIVRGSVSAVIAVLLSTPLCAVIGQEAEGIKLTEATSVSPFLEGSITYDSNVPLNPEGEEEDDFFGDIILGLSLLRAPEASTLNLRGWYQIRQYQEFSELDKHTWQENIEFVWGQRDTLQIILKQRRGKLADYEFTQSDSSAQSEREESGQRLIETRTRRTERILDDLGASLAHETRILSLNLGGYYAGVSFENDDEYRLYDWHEIYLTPRIDLKLSEKTALSLSGDIGQQESDNELKDLEYFRVRLGLHLNPSEKTDLRIAGGIQQHRVTGGSDNLNQERFHFKLNSSWMMTQKMRLQLYGQNELLPTSAFSKNTKRVDQGSVGLVYDFSPRLFISGAISYRRDTYTDPVREVPDPVEEQRGAQLRIVLRNREKNIKIYLKGRYEIFTSNIQEDYNQLRLTLGASIAF